MNRLFSFFDKKLTFNISVKIPVALLLLLPLLAYLVWEYYWANKVGYHFVKWHTHLMPYVYIGLGGLWLMSHKIKRGLSEKSKLSFLVFFSTVLAFFIVELFFVLSGTMKTYMEVITGCYKSPYSPQEKNYYYTWMPGVPHWLKKPEYNYWRPGNSLGFADEEWIKTKKPGEKRIIGLGDSFTEGDGAPFDSSYVAILRQMLTGSGRSFYVMNAGICGSDPFINYVNLKDKLLDYRPDIVIQSFGSGDILLDILFRGGMERFQKNGTLKYPQAPWWEPIYVLNYTSRVFFKLAGYNELLRKSTPSKAEKIEMEKSVTALFITYAELCRKNNIQLIIVLHPEKAEIEANRYNYDLHPLIDPLTAQYHVRVVDLLPAYQKYLAHSHSKIADYYWHYDGHHNSRGYKMMAETTLENILPILSDTSDAQTP